MKLAARLSHHHRARDSGVVAERHVQASDALLGQGGGDRAAHIEPWATALFAPDLDIGPVQASWSAERLRQRLFGGEASRQRAQRQIVFGSGEQSLTQTRRTFQRHRKAGDVDHIDPHTNDHWQITRRR
jgi:hypothetical protein